jgi:hypothetical protein
MIEEYIPDGSIVFTDAWPSYSVVPTRHHIFSVDRSKGEYIRKDTHPIFGHLEVTTIDLEGFW